MSAFKKIVWICMVLSSVTIDINAQQRYEAPALSNKDSWSMILLPDPQNYQRYERNSPIFDLMTAWISENIEPLHIKLVLCTGDLVINNNVDIPEGNETNLGSRQQWQAVARSFNRLDNKVPYITALGNHDYGKEGIDDNRDTRFGQYFPITKNKETQKLYKETALDAKGEPSLGNDAFEFISPKGKKFLIITLEYAPRDIMINWAQKLINSDKYKGDTVILLTHGYLNAEGKYIEGDKYLLHQLDDANFGKSMWEKLVKPSRNIRLVLSGHIAGNDFKKSVGFRTDTAVNGKIVQQMVFNAQALGGGNRGNGGDGWLRILEFLPDNKTIKVKTFSPFFAISPSTQSLAWRKAAWDEFTFQIDE